MILKLKKITRRILIIYLITLSISLVIGGIRWKSEIPYAKAEVACLDHKGLYKIDLWYNHAICRDGYISDYGQYYGDRVYEEVYKIREYNNKLKFDIVSLGLYSVLF